MAGQIWTYRILEAKDTSICPNQFYVVFTDGRKEIYTNIDDGDEIRTICERLNKLPDFMPDCDNVLISEADLKLKMSNYVLINKTTYYNMDNKTETLISISADINGNITINGVPYGRIKDYGTSTLRDLRDIIVALISHNMSIHDAVRIVKNGD